MEFLKPELPPMRSHSQILGMKFELRLDRFFKTWFFTCGNESMSMLASGLSREQLDDFRKNNEAFRRRMHEVNILIADRLRLILQQRIGYVGEIEGMKLALKGSSDYLLAKALQAVENDIAGEASSKPAISLPRPAPSAVPPPNMDAEGG
jgi:hypothetical protein